jgi:hypothetical protein
MMMEVTVLPVESPVTAHWHNYRAGEPQWWAGLESPAQILRNSRLAAGRPRGGLGLGLHFAVHSVAPLRVGPGG